MIGTSRMNRIFEIDLANRRAVVEAGVVNLSVTNAVKQHGLHYAPDPSSQRACTIGGNVATNSGGPHTLKYGVTVNHVLGVELVLPNGEVVQLGGAVEDVPGYDLTGLVVGAEGTFGIVTKATLRLVRQPEAWRTLLGVFESVDDATNTISDIIGAGIIPAALEMMDQLILEAVEAAFHFGFPLDAGAVLIIEVDGLEAGLDSKRNTSSRSAAQNNARDVRVARDEAERACSVEEPQAGLRRRRPAGPELLHARRRRAAHQAAAHPAPDHRDRAALSAAHRQRLPRRRRQHPPDPAVRRTRRRPGAARAGGQPRDSRRVHRLGGSVTGEHGIGVEKIAQMPLLFSPVCWGGPVRGFFSPPPSFSGKTFPPARGGGGPPGGAGGRGWELVWGFARGGGGGGGGGEPGPKAGRSPLMA